MTDNSWAVEAGYTEEQVEKLFKEKIRPAIERCGGNKTNTYLRLIDQLKGGDPMEFAMAFFILGGYDALLETNKISALAQAVQKINNGKARSAIVPQEIIDHIEDVIKKGGGKIVIQVGSLNRGEDGDT